jgi:hypothetical protein
MRKNRSSSQIKQSTTLIIVLFAVFLAFGPIAYYISRFHDYPPVTNPSELGTFGDFIGGTTNVILGLFNIALVAYIAINLGNRERDIEKMKLLFEISRQWNSEGLMQSRTKADALLREDPNASLTEIDDRYTDKAAPLWVVLRFFQDLQKAIDRDIVDTGEAVEWFGRDFVWWDTVGVKGTFPVNWDSEAHWSRLKESVYKSSNYNYWIEEANNILTQYKENHVKKWS